MRKQKTIKRIGKCYGKFAEFEGKKVFVEFTNGTSSLRNLCHSKKIGYLIYQNYTRYVLNWNDSTDCYDFREINEEEKKIVEEENATKVIPAPEIPKSFPDGYDPDPLHEKYGMIKTCLEANIPVYLYGPAGTGKNFTLQRIAHDAGLDFYFTNSVQQEYKITGFIDAGGLYHETEFYKAFTNGGMFFLDEMDSSIPEVLVLLNAAIANGYFEFPNGRQFAHKDFRVVAAGNTIGSGSDELYTGRFVLDAATLDRFVTIEFNYSRPIEIALAKGNIVLVDFVRELRRSAQQQGIRATFSYRCIMSVAKLEKCGLPLKEIMEIAVFKGMKSEDIRSFNVDTSSKYSRCLQELKTA